MPSEPSGSCRDEGGVGGGRTGTPTFALPPEIIVLIARKCRHRNLTILHLVSRRTHEVLDVPSLWCGAAVDRAGGRAALAWAVGRRCGNPAVLRHLSRRVDCDVELGFRTAALRGHDVAAAVLLERQTEVPSDALEIAAAKGHLGTLRTLWDSSASARAREEARPLHAAAREGHIGVVEFLMDREAVSFAPLALQAACAGGHAEVVRALLERGPGLAPSYGLETAVSLGHADVVKEFLFERKWDGPEAPARVLEPQPGILALAVREEQFEVIRVLVAAWARGLESCGHLAACFHYAVVQNRSAVVELFVELGVPVPPGSLDFAIKESATEMVRLLLRHVVSGQPAVGPLRHDAGCAAAARPLVGHFNFAVSMGNPEIVALFLRAGDPDHVGMSAGITRSAREIALLVAAERGHLEVARMLCAEPGGGHGDVAGVGGSSTSYLVRALARAKAEIGGHLQVVDMLDSMAQPAAEEGEIDRRYLVSNVCTNSRCATGYREGAISA